MYQRIKNRLDVELAEEEWKNEGMSENVISRIKEVVSMLDKSYGEKRTAHDMGGYVFFFRTKENYDRSIIRILDFYNLKKSEYEYSDNITEGTDTDVQWWEELYMLSSDDSLVFIHPRGEHA